MHKHISKSLRRSKKVWNWIRRKGSILILSAFALVMIFGCLSFAVDVGLLAATKAQMRTAADASALAAGMELLKGLGTGATATSSVTQSDAKNAASSLAAAHRAGDVPALYVNPSGDLRFGNRNWNGQKGQWVETWDSGPFNMVQVNVRRDQKYTSGSSSTPGDRQLNLFFGPVIGQKQASLSVSATAALLPGVGFRLPAGSTRTIGILPIALDQPTWDSLIQNSVGTDLFSYNSSTGKVASGSDGIREVNLYPNGSASLPPGNRGTVDIGSPNNSTSDLKRQILYGQNAYDLSFFPNSQIRTDTGPLYLNGDTGISAGIKAELAQIIGQVRAIPIFTAVSGPGNNATYTIVKFVGVRIMDVNLTGSPSNKHVTVQPAPYTDSNIIPGQAAISPDSIYAPVRLVH